MNYIFLNLNKFVAFGSEICLNSMEQFALVLAMLKQNILFLARPVDVH